MKIHEAAKKSNKIRRSDWNEGEYMDLKSDNTLLFVNEILKEDWEPIVEPPLTIERIKKECVAGESLLVDEDGDTRLYLGFNRNGTLVTDLPEGTYSVHWSQNLIKDWKISEEKWEG